MDSQRSEVVMTSSGVGRVDGSGCAETGREWKLAELFYFEK